MEISFDRSGANPDELLHSVYAANYPWLLQYVQQNSGNVADAQDVFQDSVYAAWTNLREGRFTGNSTQFNAYLRQICKHKWLNHLKSTSRTRTNYQDNLEDLEQPGFDPQAVAEQLEQGRLLKDCFAQLGDKCRQVLGLFYYRRKSLAQIATEINNTEDSVKTIKYRCMMQLRKLYLEQNKANGGL